MALLTRLLRYTTHLVSLRSMPVRLCEGTCPDCCFNHEDKTIWNAHRYCAAPRSAWPWEKHKHAT